MTTPEWLKPGIYGALVGAVLISIAGFTWGGWMTSGTATELAEDKSKGDVIAALLPVCLDLSATDSDREAKLTTIRDASTFKRRDAVMEAGWATIPGTEAPNRDLARACLEGLDLDAS